MIKKILIVAALALFLTGCEDIPSKVYKMSTVDGTIVYMSCPTIDPSKSVFSYSISGGCLMVVKPTVVQ